MSENADASNIDKITMNDAALDLTIWLSGGT